MQSKTESVTADAIQTTPEELILIMKGNSVSIPWAQCSNRLARASSAERSAAILSLSGYGIHWPLIDEDLAVGPLIKSAS